MPVCRHERLTGTQILSTEQTDISITGQPKGDVRQIFHEITQLPRGDMPLTAFCSEFLNRVVAAMGAAGGAFWTVENGTLMLTYQINIQNLNLKIGEADERQHSRLITHITSNANGAVLVPAHSSFGNDADDKAESGGNPSDYPLLCFPLRTELETAGMVEIMLRPGGSGASPTVSQALLQFFAQSGAVAVDYFKNRQLRNFADRQSLWMQLEDFTRTIHQGLDIKTTAYTLANEGRRLIQCDRVSIAQNFGSRCKITAISGQDVIDKRSKTVNLLGRLATAVVKAGEPVWYSGDTANFAPQVEKAVDAYVDESHTRMIVVFPLMRSKKTEETEEERRKRKEKPEKPFGALIIEQIEDRRESDGMKQRIKVVAEHAGTALGNALEHHHVFLMPLWKFIGKSKILIAARHLPKTAAASVLLIALIAALIFLPWKFQIYCSGTLEPIRRQRIYSPLEAEIKKLYVDHHSPVQGPSAGQDGKAHRGTLLVELRSSELDASDAQLHGEQQEVIEKITSLTRMMQDQDRRMTDYDKADLAGQMKQARIQLETVQQKLAIFEMQQKPDLYITSPMDGVVISWDIKQRLTEKRPISRMQYVMEIADLSGDWQLELAMPEKKMGYIGDSKKVEFVLATDPSKKYEGTIVEVHDRAEVRTDLGNAGNNTSGLNTVLIKVSLDQKELLPEILRPGAECSARIDCGKRSLGFVLFYEAIAFVQKNILFRWF
jgi:hypothetical protein